jgi:hypothetical protein
VAANRELVPLLDELSPEHFDAELHRRLQGHLVSGAEPTADLVPLVAELDARAAAEAIDAGTAKELLLRLRERRLRRRLATSELEETLELQEQLARIREAVESLS